MRILKFVAVALGVLVVLFFTIGFINPVFEYGNTVVIKAPRDTVWSLYLNQKKNWIDGFESQKLKSGEPFTKDAEYETIITSGEQMVMQEKIVSVNPGAKIEWRLSNDVLVSTYRYEFSGDSASCQVNTRYLVEGKNAFMKSVLYLSKGYLKSADAEMLSALTKLAENKKSF